MAKQALEGVKIADFGWYGVGPWTCEYLANHGATVVHVESTIYIDNLRTSAPAKDGVPGVNRSAYFAKFNSNKFGITLNLRHPRGLEVARRIVTWSDVVVENHTPGMMVRQGLGYKDLKQIKPEIIMLSASSQGQTGPYAAHPTFGTQLSGLAGLTFITGWPDRPPVSPFGAYTDAIVPPFNTVAILAALDYRRRTGKGLHLDVSQMEVSLQFLTPLLLDFAANERVAVRAGNVSPHCAPHGAYACRGNDRWCTITISTDQQWANFIKVMGDPAWSRDPEFATHLGRKKNEAELNRFVQEWTSKLEAEQVMTILQAEGIPAGVVKTCEDLSNDPQLAYRHHNWKLDHVEIGTHNYEAPAFRLSKTPCDIQMPAACLGEHNHYFYTEVLGLTDEEFTELLASGAFD